MVCFHVFGVRYVGNSYVTRQCTNVTGSSDCWKLVYRYSVKRMAADTLYNDMVIATEHIQKSQVNVVFINIHWKASRHLSSKTITKNLRVLDATISSVVRKMSPALICLCEVGQAAKLLNADQMVEVSNQCMQSWTASAAQAQDLCCMFETGAPYMSIYNKSKIQCSCHRIIHDLYYAQGQPRTAQAFLCCGPGDVTIDIINIHAPSGKIKLTNQQRQTMLSKLLQTDSKSIPGYTVGHARFLIGGDMNYGPHALSQSLQLLRDKGKLHTREQICAPAFARYGDVCVAAGFNAVTLDITAENHDPQHKPYGISWCSGNKNVESAPTGTASSSLDGPRQSEKALAYLEAAAKGLGDASPNKKRYSQNVSKETSIPQHESSTGGQAASSSSTHDAQQSVQVEAPHDPASLARLELQNLESRAADDMLTDGDIERELQKLHVKHGNIMRPEDYTEAGAITEWHCDEALEEKASTEMKHSKSMLFAIVDEFLDKMSFTSVAAEETLTEVLEDQAVLTPEMYERIEEVFSPIFFHYPKGLKDRTVWEPRDTSRYITTWYKLAEMRSGLISEATSHDGFLTPHQVAMLFDAYTEEVKKTLRQEQQGRGSTYYKSITEANLRREAGSVNVAKAIWAIGVPQRPCFVTEHVKDQLSIEHKQILRDAANNVMQWLDRLATAFVRHRNTSAYEIARRRSGAAHRESGLTDAEQHIRNAKKHTKSQLRRASNLVQQLEQGTLLERDCVDWQRELLIDFRGGLLQQRLAVLNHQYESHAQCTAPIQPHQL